MAVTEGQRSDGSKEGDVSSCVSNLIRAFGNGLDIFKRLRERRRKRKSRKQKPEEDSASGAELQLSNSLRRGPMDLQSRYENHYNKAGDRFAKGDAIAHASLAETLIKLNTGLVGIIAAFLNHDSKSNQLDLDYKSLTSLSDISRAQALSSMDQLYSRISRSQVNVYEFGGCAQCGSMKHRKCSGGMKDPAAKAFADQVLLKAKERQARGGVSKEKRRTEGTRAASSRSRSTTPIVTRVPVKSSKNQTQLAVVRPRNARKETSSSGSSTRSPSIAPLSSAPTSPLPQYAPVDPFSVPVAPTAKATQTPGRRRAGSMDEPRPTTWPVTRPDTARPLHIPTAQKAEPRHTAHRREKTPAPSSQAVPKRRADKLTPSTYTFASDSTKLGEIPERNWAQPWNYAEAERLNTEAATTGYTLPGTEAAAKPKRGIFGFLRRGAAVDA